MPDAEELFTSLEQIREAHTRLLDKDSGDGAPEPGFWVEVQKFADRLARSGIYFDEPHEIKACQGYLSYWDRELSRARAEKQFDADLPVPQLLSYDEAALRSLQSRYTNPFQGFAIEARALCGDASRARAGDELAKLVERKAAAAGLRFELDLVKEITGQLVGDAFAPKLIEFCLYHLFEDPKTRIGNKLRRRPGDRSFSCLQYLVEKAEGLRTQQGPSEQSAMLAALSLYGATFDPGVPSDATITRPKIESVMGAMSPTFQDGAGRTSALVPFLLTSRLLFEEEAGLSIVHPALFRRWPELLAAIRVRGEHDRGRRRLLVMVLAGVALASVLFAFRQWQLRQYEATEKDAISLADRSYSEKSAAQRLKTALDAVSKSPSSPTTKTALNEAIWATLAADARSAYPKYQPPKRTPEIRQCSDDANAGYCFLDSMGHSVALPGLPREDVAFATDAKEKWLAVAWPKFRGGGPIEATTVQLAVFRVGEASEAQLEGSIRDTRCTGSVENVRVAPDGSAVTIDCYPPGEGGRIWDLVTADGASVPWREELEQERDSVNALYFASSGEQGGALLKDGGIVEVSTDPANPFRSDILRVMGRPGHLAFRRGDGFAALGALSDPLVLVHERTAKATRRDAIYPVPAGLGAARSVSYSPTGQCIRVDTVPPEPGSGKAFRYHIILDVGVLEMVGQQIAGSNPHYDADSLCGFDASASSASSAASSGR